MKQYINFNWYYVNDFKESYLKSFPSDVEIVDIPHNVKNLPYNYFNELCYQKISTYKKVFDVDEDITNKIVTILFEAFMVKAKIYLNNHYLGEYASLYIPVEIDITKHVKQKDNELIVVLDSKKNKDYPPFGYAVDYLTFGGIYREVSINVHPKIYIDKILVDGDNKGNVNVRNIIINKDKKAFNITHELYLDNVLVAQSNVNSFKINKYKLWDINTPILYTLKTTIVSEFGKETYTNKFGFRTIRFEKDGFYLNDKKIKLIGLNRHQSYPYVGYAIPKSMQEDDAILLKYEAGVNVVRTSHYPQSAHFLNKCDEIGLLVINEIPGWQHIGKSKTWRNQHYENVKSMVIEEYNHPSLISHGVRIDESQDDYELYSKSNEIVHTLDNTRPTLGVRNFKNSELLEDIYAYNDFICKDLSKGLDNPKNIKSLGKPYLVTEYLGHMEPTKATDSEKQRIYHAKRHALVVNDNFKNKDCVGAIGWCFADYYTHVDFGSGDHICPHGVFDMYRNRKYAASIYQAQQDDTPVLEVLSNMKPGDFAQSVFDEIYVVTNADYVKLYKNNEFVNDFYPNDKKYKFMKHPLIKIDDLIGNTFNNQRFTKKDRKRISKVLSYVALKGMLELKLSHKLLLAKMMIKYHVKYSELVDMYNTYIASWGGKAITYTFKAIKDEKVVKEVTLSPSLSFDLKVSVNKKELVNEDTYDVCKISLKYVDQYDNLMNYANKAISIDVEGPVTLLSPKIESLLGGQLSIYIKSKNEKGNAKITITCEDIVKEIILEVK